MTTITAPAPQAARDFGIEFPRGLLLVGISGGGKTQMSLCIASYLGLPLIQLDVGSLMSKWVGESERNMREAIRLLEGLGSCVLPPPDMPTSSRPRGNSMPNSLASDAKQGLSSCTCRLTFSQPPMMSKPPSGGS